MNVPNVTETWSSLVRDSIGDMPFNQVAEKVGVSPNTVANWVKGANFGQPDARLVVRFARAVNVPLPTAMVAAGYGEASEYNGTVIVKPEMSALSADEMFDELRRRVSDKTARKRESLGKLKPRKDIQGWD